MEWRTFLQWSYLQLTAKLNAIHRKWNYRSMPSNDETLAPESRGDFRVALNNMINDALRAQALIGRTAPGFSEPTSYIRKPTLRAMATPLSTVSLPSLFDKNGRLRRVPSAAPVGEDVKMPAGVIANSRVCRAGARVAVIRDAAKPHAVGSRTNDIVFERIIDRFRNTESAQFGTVAMEDGDAPTVPFPVFEAQADWSRAVEKAVRFEFKRAERKQIEPDALMSEILTALTLGVARSADEILLSAIVASAPAVFSLAEAATQDLGVDELRAVIGTAGAGSSIDANGNLRAAGVSGELTADMSGTIVGAWNRAGIAIRDEFTIIADRVNGRGDFAVTAFVSMIPLVPDANKFWTVA